MATYLDDLGRIRDENAQLVDDFGDVIEDMDDETFFEAE